MSTSVNACDAKKLACDARKHSPISLSFLQLADSLGSRSAEDARGSCIAHDGAHDPSEELAYKRRQAHAQSCQEEGWLERVALSAVPE